MKGWTVFKLLSQHHWKCWIITKTAFKYPILLSRKLRQRNLFLCVNWNFHCQHVHANDLLTDWSLQESNPWTHLISTDPSPNCNTTSIVKPHDLRVNEVAGQKMAFFSNSHRHWEIVKGFSHRKYQLQQQEEIILILKYHKDTLKELHWKPVSSSIGSHLPQIISHGVFPSPLFPMSHGQRKYCLEESMLKQLNETPL